MQRLTKDNNVEIIYENKKPTEIVLYGVRYKLIKDKRLTKKQKEFIETQRNIFMARYLRETPKTRELLSAFVDQLFAEDKRLSELDKYYNSYVPKEVI